MKPPAPKVNSLEASMLKELWTPVVNANLIYTAVVVEMQRAKYAPFLPTKDLELELDIELVEQSYRACRDKVCEIQVLRAFARPRADGVTLAAAIRKVKELFVDKLEGVLHPKLSLFVDAAICA